MAFIPWCREASPGTHQQWYECHIWNKVIYLWYSVFCINNMATVFYTVFSLGKADLGGCLVLMEAVTVQFHAWRLQLCIKSHWTIYCHHKVSYTALSCQACASVPLISTTFSTSIFLGLLSIAFEHRESTFKTTSMCLSSSDPNLPWSVRHSSGCQWSMQVSLPL